MTDSTASSLNLPKGGERQYVRLVRREGAPVGAKRPKAINPWRNLGPPKPREDRELPAPDKASRNAEENTTRERK